jgi:hypothetical protein
MKTYNINGLHGSAAQVVAELHKTSRAPAPDDRTWMQQTADRAHLMNGSIIRADTAEHFLDDLVEANLLNTVMEK